MVSMEALSKPPGQPDKAYSSTSLGGGIVYIPCSKSATGFMGTGRDTENTFAVVSLWGLAGIPNGFRFRHEVRDIFPSLKG